VGRNLRDWHRIVASLHDVSLQEGTDAFVWSLQSSRIFSVKSMYDALINNGVRVSQEIWQIKIPTRINFFLWYLKKGVTLTKGVVYVTHQKVFNISFSIVFMPNSCGALYI
jgi:hypothetical protein